MQIKLYKTTSDNNYVDKVLTDELIIDNVVLRDSNNIINPHLTISGYNLKNYNYMYIPEFDRYYYITISSNHNMWDIDANVDVLMSFKSNIRNVSTTIIRQESRGNAYLHDSEVITNAYKLIGNRLFPQGFSTSNDSIILITAGNGGET